jgi:glycosyltransferase involved in cell wall biosynthesis
MQDIAIAHKDYDVRGGGERVAEHLAQLFDAPIFVGRRGVENEPDTPDIDLHEIDYSPLPDRIAERCIDRGGATRSAVYQIVWQQQQALEAYDTIVTSGNEPLWYVPRDDQTVIAYTHSPPRWQYDLFHDVDTSGLMGTLGIGYNYLSRVLYQHNVPRVDHWVANSDLVARRINQYWDVPMHNIDVVYPPVRTREYNLNDAVTGDYYLHLGRLAEHKRIDELLDAFAGLDETLKIAGKGPEREALEARAPSNVEFLGYVSEERKHELMAGAKAHVYPALNEDFGMVPVESMAAGTPVIGVNEGFTRFQIMDGQNGYTYDRTNGGGLRATLRRFERDGVTWTPDRIATFADRFSVEEFQRGMENAVDTAKAKTEQILSPPWSDLDDAPVTVQGLDDAEPLAPDGGQQ